MRHVMALTVVFALAACGSTPAPTRLPAAPTATAQPPTTVSPSATGTALARSSATPLPPAEICTSPVGDLTVRTQFPPRATRAASASAALQTLDDMERKWQATNILHYRITVYPIFFGPTGRRTLEVTNGQVTSALPSCTAFSQDDCLNRSEDVNTYTVPGLFGVARREASDVCRTASIEYDPQYGYPSRIRSDTVTALTDASYSLTVPAFQVLP